MSMNSIYSSDLSLAAASSVSGTSGSDILSGTGGDDAIYGQAGDDTLLASAGNDVLSGGDGTDAVSYSLASGSVTASLYSDGASANGFGGVDRYIDVENLIGSAYADQLSGDENRNQIQAGEGNDTVSGGGAADSLQGGAGNDVIYGEGSAQSTAVSQSLPVVNSNVLVNGLGGDVGFGEDYLAPNDDGFTSLIDVTSVFGSSGLNFFGTAWTGLYINNNGNITFASPTYQYTPSSIDGGVNNPMIAAFWADVDTRSGAVSPTLGGNSMGSNLVWYDLDAAHQTLTVTWDDVGYYNQATDKLNSFQMQLIGTGGGNFNIVFRYEDINWTTGVASSGAGGLGGVVARAGYTAGNNSAYYELPSSGDQDAILALESVPGNTGQAGVYVFSVSNGVIDVGGNDTLEGGAGDDVLNGGYGNDVFVYTAGQDQGVDTIQDFSLGDVINVIGADFAVTPTEGTGATTAQNIIEVSHTGTTSTLYIGTDTVAGADLVIHLSGVYTADQFYADGAEIGFTHAPIGSLVIYGTPAADQLLTAAGNIGDLDGLGVLSYQWLRDGVVIDGATGVNYTTVATDVGHSITVQASYIDGIGTHENVTSHAVAIPAPNVNDAPVGSVVIDGRAEQGQTLTAQADLTDADGLGSFSYQWLADGVAIAGATASTFALTQAQVGQAISLQVSYTDGAGYEELVTSSATDAVVNLDDEATGVLALTGVVQEGGRITASLTQLEDADGTTSISYQWQVADGSGTNWTAVSGATAASFDIASDQTLVGQQIRVLATSTDALGGTTEFLSNASTVANVNDAPTGGVVIAGRAQQGQTLSASNTLADADGMGAVSYQWLANGVLILNATASSFTLTQAQLGKTISVQARYVDGYGTSESVSSQATTAVTVVVVNHAPTAGNTTITTSEDVVRVLRVADFGFVDADSTDSLQAITITSAPSAGQLLLNGTAVTVGQSISSADLAAGKLAYTPVVNANGAASARWGFKVFDGHEWSAQAYTMAVDITPVRDDQVINGTAGNDTLTGDGIDAGSYDQINGLAGNDQLLGLAGNDTLNGGNGDDTLDGGTGADSMVGGDGADLYYVDHSADRVVETNTVASVGGTDWVLSSLSSYTLTANVENGAINSADAGNLTGNSLNNVLYASAGNNVFDGGIGADTAHYGYAASAVTLNLALTGAQVTGGSGTDTLIAIENLTGSGFNDRLTGNAGANVLTGGAGNDTLNGSAGDDTLNGGSGADSMVGGNGSDSYFVDSTADRVLEMNIDPSVGGVDTVLSSLSSYTLGANIENGRINTTGSASLLGNTLNNVLYTGAGNSLLNGGSGNDTASYGYAAGSVIVSLATTAAQNTVGSGMDTLVSIENLTGSGYNDKLTGNADNNLLHGGAGNDSLNGAAGQDTLLGAAGKDTLTGGAGNDVFDFNVLSELGLGSTARDVITDFAVGADKIDLSGIDTNAALAGDQAFSFVTSFTTTAGQVRYAGGIVYLNTDSDTAAEYEIQLTGTLPASLTAANFVL